MLLQGNASSSLHLSRGQQQREEEWSVVNSSCLYVSSDFILGFQSASYSSSPRINNVILLCMYIIHTPIKSISVLLASLPNLKVAGLSTLFNPSAGDRKRVIETFLLPFLFCQGEEKSLAFPDVQVGIHRSHVLWNAARASYYKDLSQHWSCFITIHFWYLWVKLNSKVIWT